MTEEIRTLEEQIHTLQKEGNQAYQQSRLLEEQASAIQKRIYELRAQHILEKGLLKLFDWEIFNGTQARMKRTTKYDDNILQLHKAANWNGERLYFPLEGGLILTIGESDEVPRISCANLDSDYNRSLEVIQFIVKYGLNTDSILSSMQKHADSLKRKLADTENQITALQGVNP